MDEKLSTGSDDMVDGGTNGFCSRNLRFEFVWTVFGMISKINPSLPRNKENEKKFNEFKIEHEKCEIARVKQQKYLGLIIDEKLSWLHHIEYIKRKITFMIFAMKKVRKYINEKAATKLYHSYILSNLNYINPVWNAAKSTNHTKKKH
jgi:hypothetical protein